MQNVNTLIEAQLESYNILLAFYPLPNEITLSSASALFVDSYEQSRSVLIKALELTLSLEIPSVGSIQLFISLPFTPESMKCTLLQSVTLPRSEFDALHLLIQEFMKSVTNLELMETNSERILALADYLRELPSKAIEPPAVVESIPVVIEQEFRVYFNLISLSTREKRDDMVNWAAGFQLTGFVLAGKPGLLCLEGTTINIDLYMKDIKSISWADIPSFQKKITEKLRQSITTRLFTQMTEITDLFTKGGFLGNKADLTEVRSWLRAQGVEEEVFFEILGIKGE